MSSVEAWFFNSLSLKYLATVRTVEVLWKRPGALHGIREYIAKILQERTSSEYTPIPLVHSMSTRFDNYLDELHLPTTIKDDLSLCFWQMLQEVFDSALIRFWIRHYAKDLNMVEQTSDNIVNHLTQWTSWDAIGRIDHKKMMEINYQAVETMTFDHWALLCHSCSEKYIRKFADTVNWKECLFTPITIFWYSTIHGTFPTENMFASTSYYEFFQQERDAGCYEERNINHTLLRYSVYAGHIWAAKFFCNRLTDAQKLEMISSQIEVILERAPKDIVVYLLAQIKFNYPSVEAEQNSVPLRHLLSWPYVMFIDSWIDNFKNVYKDQFIAVFTVLMENRRGEQAAGIEEFRKSQVGNYLYAMYYVPCERLWTLCCNNFSLEDEVVLSIVSLILNSEDIILCKIVMKGSTSTWRHRCLDYILKYCGGGLEFMANEEFCAELMREILIHDEEREYFQQIRSWSIRHWQMLREDEVMNVNV